MQKTILKQHGNKYPVLCLTEKSRSILFEGKKVFIKKKLEKEYKIEPENTNFNHDLFEILRKIRKDIASKNNVPPFIIFSDISLKQMATFMPISRDEMLKISRSW